KARNHGPRTSIDGSSIPPGLGHGASKFPALFLFLSSSWREQHLTAAQRVQHRVAAYTMT
ncbi:MAG: hypothetical protein ABF802_13810, partial [Acetobacter orientalis]